MSDFPHSISAKAPLAGYSIVRQSAAVSMCLPLSNIEGYQADVKSIMVKECTIPDKY